MCDEPGRYWLFMPSGFTCGFVSPSSCVTCPLGMSSPLIFPTSSPIRPCDLVNSLTILTKTPYPTTGRNWGSPGCHPTEPVLERSSYALRHICHYVTVLVVPFFPIIRGGVLWGKWPLQMLVQQPKEHAAITSYKYSGTSLVKWRNSPNWLFLLSNFYLQNERKSLGFKFVSVKDKSSLHGENSHFCFLPNIPELSNTRRTGLDPLIWASRKSSFQLQTTCKTNILGVLPYGVNTMFMFSLNIPIANLLQSKYLSRY